MAISILAAPLVAGDPAPSLSFVDIEGRPGATSQFDDWVIVYSFAGRESSDRVMNWQRDVGLTIAKRYPDLKVAYINFADLTIVPNLFRKVVTPLLKHMNQGAMEELLESYDEQGIQLNRARTDFYLVPDWSGEYLRVFRIPDTDKFHVWLAAGGKIRGYFVEGEEGLSEHYLDVFSRLVSPVTTTTASPATTSTR